MLFDLGYFSFEWLDDLTRRHQYWISRLRAKTSYQLIHELIVGDGYREALVFLGTYHADRAEYAVRLIEVLVHGRWQRSVTNVLDPSLLTGAQVVQLYARRWDIELGLRALKDHLRLRVLWGAKWEVIQVQVLATVALAQCYHALQMHLAMEAGVSVFEVSLDVLMRLVPLLVAHERPLLPLLIERGRPLGLLRPSTRLHWVVAEITVDQMGLPPSDVVLRRTPRVCP